MAGIPSKEKERAFASRFYDRRSRGHDGLSQVGQGRHEAPGPLPLERSGSDEPCSGLHGLGDQASFMLCHTHSREIFMESSNYNSATTSAWMGNGNYLPQGIDFDDAGRTPPLRFRALRTARERQAIASLRRHAAFGVEQDLGLDLEALEQTRDEVGLVTAVSRGPQTLATLRVVPTGHRLTGAER